MIATWQSPVLSLEANVVQGIDGRDALCKLCLLFTKCKNSLAEGRRLENLSWRLWHREVYGSQLSQPVTPDSASPHSCSSRSHNPRNSEKQIVPETRAIPPSPYRSPAPSSLGSEIKTSPQFVKAYDMLFGHQKQQPHRSVGKIICSILPHSTTSPTSTDDCRTYLRQSPSNIPYQHVPSVPELQLPSPSSIATPPKVVVVTPTPRPTPPGTPVVIRPTSPLIAATKHLTPPLVILPCPKPEPQHQPHASSSKIRNQSPPVFASPPLPKSSAVADEKTIRTGDRRFFLQHSPEQNLAQTPSASTERSSTTSTSGTSSRPTGGSTDSSHAAALRQRRPPGPTRTASHKLGTQVARHATAINRRNSDSLDRRSRAAFNIGSESSTGSKDTPADVSRSPSQRAAVPNKFNGSITSIRGTTTTASAGSNNASGSKYPPSLGLSALPNTTTAFRDPSMVPPLPPAAAAPNQRRRIIVASTDSECDDSDSWESDEDSIPDRGGGGSDDKDIRLREAALEVQRQRELFAKVPKRSYSNLGGRTQSVGLLSALLNPDPSVFPPNHPYRTSYSSHDLQRLKPKTPMQTVTGSAAGQQTAIVMTTDGKKKNPQNVVLPLAAQTSHINAQALTSGSHGHGPRLKGRPHGQEMDSDSEESGMDHVQVSRSIAQERLTALAGRHGSARTNSTNDNTAKVTDPREREHERPQRPRLVTVATAPIPFTHPYNLPAPPPPTSPRTTRRQMLSTELSESLRRNLLWARQVSKTSMMGGSRRPSAGGGIGGGIRPLTTIVDGGGGGGGMNGAPPTSTRSDDVDPMAERKRASIARNRSWADDYHYAGW